VCCARPAPEHAGRDHPIGPPEVSEEHHGALLIESIELPSGCGWRRLDARSGWQEFAAGASDALEGILTRAKPAAVVAIDWTGAHAWSAMRAAWPSAAPAAVYINFRVYAAGLAEGDAAADDYNRKERCALGTASYAMCLSVHDQTALRELLPPTSSLPIEVLLPCLRGDLEALARQLPTQLVTRLPVEVAEAAKAASGRRCFVTCAVRLSTEKDPMLVRARARMHTPLAARAARCAACPVAESTGSLTRPPPRSSPPPSLLSSSLGCWKCVLPS
jgi:hypothetical protein